jgi:hypothetical protein
MLKKFKAHKVKTKSKYQSSENSKQVPKSKASDAETSRTKRSHFDYERFNAEESEGKADLRFDGEEEVFLPDPNLDNRRKKHQTGNNRKRMTSTCELII